MKPQTISLLCIVLLLFVTVHHSLPHADDNEEENEENTEVKEQETAADENDETENANETSKKKSSSKKEGKEAASGGGISEKIEIIVPKREKRKYLGVVLENKMKVILIHDENTDTAAMAMVVGGGVSQGPTDVEGLPNLVQFSITDGNEKYKNPDDFPDYINDVGGSWNGFIYYYRTGFYCSSPAGRLLDTVDRFSALFDKPLFKKKRVEANIKTIDDLFQLNVESEDSRLDSVKESTFSKGSRFQNAVVGNEESLKMIPEEKGINVRDEMFKFFNDYYSSDKMYLALLGKESLDELQQIAVEYFGSLKPNDVELVISESSPLTEEQLMKRISVASLSDTYYMELDFAIPDPTFVYYKATISYIKYFLENKAPGSLYAFLHENGLINNIWVVIEAYDRGASVFELNFDLTKNGLAETDTIIKHLFQYWAMVQENGIQDWIYEEIKQVAEYNFEFSANKNWFDATFYPAFNIADIPIADALYNSVPKEFDKDLLQIYMDCLVPDNMRIILKAKQFADVADETASLIPAKYKIEDIESKLIKSWKKVKPNENFEMPTPNECIPENFDLLPIENVPNEISQFSLSKGFNVNDLKEKILNNFIPESKIPEIVQDTDLIRLWLYQDSVFQLPKNFMNVYLRSPKFTENPRNIILTSYFASLFSDKMVEYTYKAAVAGYNFEVGSYDGMIYFSFEGYSDKFAVLVGTVFEYIGNFEYTDDMFDIAQDNIRRGIENWKSSDSYELSDYYLYLLLSTRRFTGEEYLAVIEEITSDDVKKFNSAILEEIFLEAFLYGNCNKDYAEEIYGIIEPYLKDSKAFTSEELLYSPEIILEKGETYVYPIQAVTSDSYANTVYYQCNAISSRGLALLNLFNTIIENSFNDALRVDEQISYMYYRSVRMGDTILGLSITIQSKVDNEKIDDTLENYLESVDNILQELTDKDLEPYKSSLKYGLTKKFEEMDEQFAEFTSEISSLTYDFKRYQMEASELEQITSEELIEFYSTYFKPASKKRTKLLVYVVPKDKDDTYSPPKGAFIIDDINKFKDSQKKSKPPKQSGDYPPIGADCR